MAARVLVMDGPVAEAPPNPEAALIERLIAGDEAAHRGFYRAHAADVHRLARRFVHSDAEADEVVQEVFLSAFKAIDRFRGGSKLRTWLYRITVNRALKRQRWWSRRREVGSEPLDHRAQRAPGPEVRAADREALDIVRRCLDALDDRKRTVLVLHELEGLDTKEIAAVLDCPRSTVLTRLSRARAELIRSARALGVALPDDEGEAR